MALKLVLVPLDISTLTYPTLSKVLVIGKFMNGLILPLAIAPLNLLIPLVITLTLRLLTLFVPIQTSKNNSRVTKIQIVVPRPLPMVLKLSKELSRQKTSPKNRRINPSFLTSLKLTM